MPTKLFRKKSLIGLSQQDTHGSKLNRVLNVRDLTFMGIAAVIGAGIFSTIGQASYNGGPGVIFLFIIIAFACGFTALCYAEFASRIPVSGSAYTYSYVSFGELAAWIIGWALILEYAIGNVVVSISWSSYFSNLLEGVGINMPAWLGTDSVTAENAFNNAIAAGANTADMAWTTAPLVAGHKLIINLPAFIIVVLITMLAYVGIRESKKSANFMVILKLVVLLVIVAIGVFYIDTNNWNPMMPNGFTGVLKGVSAIFFAYIGFDAISTTAEECANPQRDLPRGMIYSLIICTIIYVIVTLVITGMVNYSEFNNVVDPLAFVFEKIHLGKIGFFISVSAVIAATSVLLVFQLGQPRIWMSMSRDGLLPKRFSKIHPKYQTPAFATIITGVIVGIPALFVESALMTDLTSIGTLFAFVLVCGGVLMLPKDETPNTTKRFRLPYINGRFIVPVLFAVFVYGFRGRIGNVFFNLPNGNHHKTLFDFFVYDFGEQIGNIFINLSNQSHQEILFAIFIVAAIIITVASIVKSLSLIPVLGMLCCLYLMIEIPVRSWIAFFGWMAVGLVIYFCYGYWRSKLATKA